MAPEGRGNIRVFVRWHDQTVFAGEEVKCTITFKNVARPAGSPAAAPSSSKSSPYHSRNPPVAGADLLQTSPILGHNISKSPSALAPPPAGRGHRATLSLSVPSAASTSRARAGSIQWSPQTPQDGRPRNGQAVTAGSGNVNGSANVGSNGNGNGTGHGHSHKRSLSIVSMGTATMGNEQQSNGGPGKSQRPARGHARASSLQIVPRGGNSINGPRSASYIHRPFTSQPSPLFNSSYPPDRSASSGRSSGASTVPNTPSVGIPRASPRSGSGSDTLSEFRFPMVQPSRPDASASSPQPKEDGVISLKPLVVEASSLPVRGKDTVPTINEHAAAPAARILSTTSISGTPRSSGEFYSLSNNSTETLASEYVTQQPLRSQGRPAHIRRPSNLSSNSSPAKLPESLMMGYAQIQGSFTLDGSLVNLGPFEQVKRKAVVGGQGGGVIGVETSKRDSSLLRGFGWGSLTSSIGELLGGGELSTIKDMRGIASSKAIPLLSTPQSVLFVDLKLAPGESKTYEYAFNLPKGLPPTHRGKAMKTSYSLVIGTQRPGGAKEQQVTSVEVPFRVLGSVNDHGEILGHDLMNPYIILRDQARVQAVSKPHNQTDADHKARAPDAALSSPESTLNSFLAYADELLSRRTDGSGPGLLSPTALPSSRRASTYSAHEGGAPSHSYYTRGSQPAPTASEAIDHAIQRSNLALAGLGGGGGGGGGQPAPLPHRFEIARNGRRVGTVTLARAAYRLGETVTLAVDFAGAELLCLAVHAALEAAERVVDPALALRSDASVHRVTRRVYAAASEATMYARRAVFAHAVPAAATPEFVTSGVALEWKVRLEFVVPVGRDAGEDGGGGGAGRTGAGDRIEEEDEEEDEDDGQGDGGDNYGSPHTPGRKALGQHQHQHQDRRRQPPHPLLEEISRDDRGGLVLVAAETIPCESFEVAVPLRVYGAVGAGLDRLERDEALEEGLVV